MNIDSRADLIFYIIVFALGVINALALIAFVVLISLIYTGVILASTKIIIAAIVVAAINFVSICLIPLYIRFRKG